MNIKLQDVQKVMHVSYKISCRNIYFSQYFLIVLVQHAFLEIIRERNQLEIYLLHRKVFN